MTQPIFDYLAGGKQFFARGDDEIQVEILLPETRDGLVVEVEDGTILRLLPIARELFYALRRHHRSVKRADGRPRDRMERVTFFNERDQRSELVGAFYAAALKNKSYAF